MKTKDKNMLLELFKKFSEAQYTKGLYWGQHICHDPNLPPRAEDRAVIGTNVNKSHEVAKLTEENFLKYLESLVDSK